MKTTPQLDLILNFGVLAVCLYSISKWRQSILWSKKRSQKKSSSKSGIKPVKQMNANERIEVERKILGSQDNSRAEISFTHSQVTTNGNNQKSRLRRQEIAPSMSEEE